MRRARRGFTLVEVMVALAIFLLAAVALGSAYVNVLNAYERVGRSSLGDQNVRFARGFVLAEPDLVTVEKGGDFDGGDNRRVRWSATIEPTATADLFTVNFTCEVSGPEMAKPEKTEETFRLLRPTWSKPADREQLRQSVRDRIQKALQAATGNS